MICPALPVSDTGAVLAMVAARISAYREGMDLHCPAVVMCLAPGDEIPLEVGGHRVGAGYVGEGITPARDVTFGWRPAPTGGLWSAILAVADLHRGEGVLLIADAATLDGADLRGVALSVDSGGPVRIKSTPPDGPVDNPSKG